VVLKNGVTQSEDQLYPELVTLVRECIGAIAYFKKVIAVPALPKTRSGKILRVVLKNMANGLPPNPPGTIEDMVAIDHAQIALKKLGYPLPKDYGQDRR